MKLFKNEVGRPSNEVLRKRRIVKVSIAIAIIAVISIIIGSVTLLVSNNNVNNLKGAVSAVNDKISVDIKANNFKIKKRINSVNDYFGLSARQENNKATANIKNSNNYTIYYKIIDGVDSLLASGKIASGNSKNITFEFDDIYSNSFDVVIYLFDSYNSYSKSPDLHDSSFVSDMACYYIDLAVSENFVFSSLGPSDIEKANWEEGKYLKGSIYDAYKVPLGKSKLTTYLYNLSGSNYYYKWFTYETKEISQDTNNYSGQCMILNSNSEKYFSTVLSLSEKYPNRAGLLKFYNNKTACLNDKHGVKDNNVVWRNEIELIGITDPIEDTDINTFKVIYDANGGKGTMADQEIIYGQDTKLKKNAFTKSGHRFTGWKAKKIIDGKDYFYGCTTIGDCKEVDAKWLTKDKIKSYFNYKDEEIVSKIVEKNETVTMVANWGVMSINISPTQPTKVINLPEIFKPLKKISDFFKSIFNLFK